MLGLRRQFWKTPSPPPSARAGCPGPLFTARRKQKFGILHIAPHGCPIPPLSNGAPSPSMLLPTYLTSSAGRRAGVHFKPTKYLHHFFKQIFLDYFPSIVSHVQTSTAIKTGCSHRIFQTSRIFEASPEKHQSRPRARLDFSPYGPKTASTLPGSAH